MKTNYIHSITIALFAMLFTSCETEIEFNGYETNPLLVVNSFITPDSVIKVNVTKSKFFLEENYTYELINNAEVLLWVNGIQKEKLTFIEKGNYTAKYKPKAGDEIKITASTPQFSMVEGTVTLPLPVTINSLDTTVKKLESTPMLNYTVDQFGKEHLDTIGMFLNNQMNFKLNFTDPAGENYYRLVVKQRKYFADSSYIDSPFFINSNDLVFGTTDETNIFDESNFNYYFEFSDEIFNGKSYGLTFFFNYTLYDYFEPQFPPKVDKPGGYVPYENSELIIDLQSISKSYYFYVKTLKANSSVSEFFSEPVQIHTNVKGGIGIIGGYTQSVYKMKIPAYLENVMY
jgi:hypothetical protein